LKFAGDPKEVYFIESTGNRGVALNKWSFIKKHIGDFYDIVCFRHLECERDDLFSDNLEQFTKEVIGLKYDIKVNQLL
jgi:hypothetical protein